MTTTALAKLDDRAAQLDQIATDNQLATVEDGGPFSGMLRCARGIKALEEALDDETMKELVMPLQGSILGFRTDKDKDGGYPLTAVRRVVITAALNGFRVTNNEFNIIAGNFYGAKNGLRRKVAEHPGLSGLRMQPSVPRMKDGGALVDYQAEWQISGRADHIKRTFAVKVNKYQGSDAILGKAERKMYHAIMTHLTGSSLPEGEVDTVIDVEVVAVNGAPSIAAWLAQNAPKLAASDAVEILVAEDLLKSGKGLGDLDPAKFDAAIKILAKAAEPPAEVEPAAATEVDLEKEIRAACTGAGVDWPAFVERMGPPDTWEAHSMTRGKLLAEVGKMKAGKR